MFFKSLQKSVQLYKGFVHKRPFLSNCITYGTLACSAEITQQMVERKVFQDVKDEVWSMMISKAFHINLVTTHPWFNNQNPLYVVQIRIAFSRDDFQKRKPIVSSHPNISITCKSSEVWLESHRSIWVPCNDSFITRFLLRKKIQLSPEINSN